MSDYGNITYKDTGTIPGYSLSLTKFKYDTLLGIGYGDSTRDLKIEIYRESDSAVESVAVYELENTDFSQEYKAYFIDAERGIIGLGIYDDTIIPDQSSRYIFLRYDGYTLEKVAQVSMKYAQVDDMRACIADGFAYLFGHEDIKVIDAVLTL